MILQREENEGCTLRSRGCAELGTWDLCPNRPIKTALGKAIAPQDGTEEMKSSLLPGNVPEHRVSSGFGLDATHLFSGLGEKIKHH